MSITIQLPHTTPEDVDVIFGEDSGDDHGLNHVVCDCTPGRTLCGIKSATPTDELDPPRLDSFNDQDCVVCIEIDKRGCPNCCHE